MSFQLFNQTSHECSKLITNRYSTSFSLGINLLEEEIRWAVYSVYGFVRFADEIVDTFHQFDKSNLLARFKKETYTAIDEEISLNPILNSFQIVVNKYKIDHILIEAFLTSMEMDLEKVEYDDEKYNEYIYGSAEVVGLMCLQVFCKGDKTKYDELKSPARKLGAAFQKVNLLRDLKSAFDERERIYFPGIDFDNFTAQSKKQIEADIRNDFKEAFSGIIKLPLNCRFGVYTAYKYYYNLLLKIERTPAKKILRSRIRVSNPHKVYLLLKSYSRYQLNIL